MSTTASLIVFSTVEDVDAARQLAEGVVAAGLAACVNILPGVTSIFRWQADADDTAQAGVQTEQEVLLVIKTTEACHPELEQHLQSEHPYELPEILAVPVTHGLQAFRQWIDASTTPS